MKDQDANGAAVNGERLASASRLRVLIVAPSLDMVGGQAVQAARLLDCWREDPVIDIALLPINPRLPGPLKKLQTIKYLRTFLTSVAYLVSLLNEVRKYDVIHVFSASYLSFILAPSPAILIARLYGKKTILNYRSGEAEDHLQRWPRTSLPIIRLADAIVAPSGYLQDVFANFGFKAHAIFNIVDTEHFRFRERRPLRPVFFSNRNFEPLYNVSCVLRAFALIQKEFPEASLTLAGDGSERGKLENLARELRLQNAHFIGGLSPERMAELYDKADIYLNGSDIDNMPGSIIESYAAGLPVVTTDAGGIPYILTNEVTGLMVPRGDHEGLAANAIRLLRDEKFAMGIISRARAECNKYSWASTKNEWLKVYESLVNTEGQMKTSEPSPTNPRGVRVDG